MRKRNVAILFRLNKKEAEVLDKKVKKSGLNREAYLRQLISGVVPRDAPPPDYYSMMRELKSDCTESTCVKCDRCAALRSGSVEVQ